MDPFCQVSAMCRNGIRRLRLCDLFKNLFDFFGRQVRLGKMMNCLDENLSIVE
jgi:hypothetical protein